MRRRECAWGRGTDRGFVTAESAVVLPVLVAFAMALVWGLLVMAAQIQCVDAARAGARAAARQDPEGAVVAMAREIAPRGARVTVSREGDRVRVTVAAEPPVLRGLPFEVREEAVAAAEDVGTGAGPGVRSGTESESGADGEGEP
ncbi:TadE family type IV pilus minor pilin [Streptomyces sp. NPDC006334]|uniref:TadE family type IV pilus minor pilin n=1 Tax=Streptomyces sp. NPDC006334 TaxID=3156754 RepID=UPI0033A057E2